MFHKAIELEFKEGTALEVTFQNGDVKFYDMSVLFQKYPQLEALRNRKLFLQGKLMGTYGIIWNDELDIETETIYEDGILVRKKSSLAGLVAADALASARARASLSQSELAQKSGVDQSDISKIERGIANPSVLTLKRLAEAMGMELKISMQ